MKKLLLGLILTAGTSSLFAQVGIGTATPVASAQLDITSTNKGLLIPRVLQANRPASPVNGLLIYQTDGTPGFYYYDGAAWNMLGGNNWSLNGNAGTAGNAKLGTTDNAALNFIVAGQQSGFIHFFLDNTSFGFKAGLNGGSGGLTAFGYQAAKSTTGSGNTAMGSNALFTNTSGTNNTAIGYKTLFSTTTGTQNTAVGFQSLYSNTTGNYNVATGVSSLYSLKDGYNNSAYGYKSLFSNISGTDNTALGYQSLMNNTAINNTALGSQSLYTNATGESNTAVGSGALYSNSTGSFNTAIGSGSLGSLDGGSYNTVIGWSAMNNGATGNNNTAIGDEALNYNTGDNNTAIGQVALNNNTTGGQNTAIGNYALIANLTGSNNTALGYDAGPAGLTGLNNTTAIGYGAKVSMDNSIVLGNSSVTSIGGYAPWTVLSDIRFKKDVASEEHGLDFIMQLKPITYHMDVRKLNQFLNGSKADSLYTFASWDEGMAKKEKILYSGFSAQQVEDAAQKIGYSFSGIHKPETERDHYSLDYASFVVPLVKAVQEQEATIEQLKKENSALQQKNNSGNDEIESLKQQIKEITERLSKLEATPPAPKGEGSAQHLN
jgi:hypothetical protein